MQGLRVEKYSGYPVVSLFLTYMCMFLFLVDTHLTNICGLCCALGLGSLEANHDAPGLSNIEAFNHDLNQVADDWECEKEGILTKAGLSRSAFQEVKVLLLPLST